MHQNCLVPFTSSQSTFSERLCWWVLQAVIYNLAPVNCHVRQLSYDVSFRCRGIRDGKAEMPKDVKEDIQQFQTALKLPGTEEQQKTASAAGPRSGAASPSKGSDKGPKVTATPAAQAQKTGAKPSPTAATPMPSTSSPAAEKPSQVLVMLLAILLQTHTCMTK